MTPAARFASLRARYLAQRARVDSLESGFVAKYGPGWNAAWLKPISANRLEAARAAVRKAEDAFAANLAAISPRDWSYGVPCHWLYEHLTYEDATRPIGEPLGVAPPLSYGAKEART